jgi:hypothetical protein
MCLCNKHTLFTHVIILFLFYNIQLRTSWRKDILHRKWEGVKGGDSCNNSRVKMNLLSSSPAWMHSRVLWTIPMPTCHYLEVLMQPAWGKGRLNIMNWLKSSTDGLWFILGLSATDLSKVERVVLQMKSKFKDTIFL